MNDLNETTDLLLEGSLFLDFFQTTNSNNGRMTSTSSQDEFEKLVREEELIQASSLPLDQIPSCTTLFDKWASCFGESSKKERRIDIYLPLSSTLLLLCVSFLRSHSHILHYLFFIAIAPRPSFLALSLFSSSSFLTQHLDRKPETSIGMAHSTIVLVNWMISNSVSP